MTHRHRSSIVVVLLAFAAMGLGGCLGVGGCNGDPATSALVKVGTGQMTQLTVEEVEALTQSLASQQGITLPEITDAEAQAAIDILNANGINTINDAVALLLRLQQDPSSVVIPPSAVEVLPSVLDLLAQLTAQAASTQSSSGT